MQSPHLRGTVARLAAQQDVFDTATQIGQQHGSRPASAPATHRDMTHYDYGPPQATHSLATRVKALKQEARGRRQERIEDIMDIATRMYQFTVEDYDHIVCKASSTEKAHLTSPNVLEP